MTARTFDISDFTPSELTDLHSYVTQSLGFSNSTEVQAAKAKVLNPIYSAATRTNPSLSSPRRRN